MIGKESPDEAWMEELEIQLDKCLEEIDDLSRIIRSPATLEARRVKSVVRRDAMIAERDQLRGQIGRKTRSATA